MTTEAQNPTPQAPGTSPPLPTGGDPALRAGSRICPYCTPDNAEPPGRLLSTTGLRLLRVITGREPNPGASD
jgi:hypothetical protein